MRMRFSKRGECTAGEPGAKPPRAEFTSGWKVRVAYYSMADFHEPDAGTIISCVCIIPASATHSARGGPIVPSAASERHSIAPFFCGKDGVMRWGETIKGFSVDILCPFPNVASHIV